MIGFVHNKSFDFDVCKKLVDHWAKYWKQGNILENSIFVITKIYVNRWGENLRKPFEEIMIGATQIREET